MMKNLGKLHNILPKSYRVALLTAVSDQGGVNFFKENNFDIDQNNLSYARRRKDEGNIFPYILSEKKEELTEKRKLNNNKLKNKILNYFSENCEKSSIPLSKNSFFFFNFYYIFIKNNNIKKNLK
jgi:hypothetical protein